MSLHRMTGLGPLGRLVNSASDVGLPMALSKVVSAEGMACEEMMSGQAPQLVPAIGGTLRQWEGSRLTGNA